MPIRFGVTRTDDDGYLCASGFMTDGLADLAASRPSIFQLVKRKVENTSRFNAVLLVPTGIGAEIGGHAGDATPVARLLAPLCDTLITHPNVVNASDINEMPENTLYVEGSVICRLLMGTAGLQPVKSNRVIVLLEAAPARVVHLRGRELGRRGPCRRRPALPRDPAHRSAAQDEGDVYVRRGSRVAASRGWRACSSCSTATPAITTRSRSPRPSRCPDGYHREYFQSEGKMVNPWGGVEAMLTHAISLLHDVPAAHSPMLESEEVADEETGLVDPRMAAEAISLGFLQCILKGLQRAPRIVSDPEAMRMPGILTANDVSCLVIPDGVLGLPTSPRSSRASRSSRSKRTAT